MCSVQISHSHRASLRTERHDVYTQGAEIWVDVTFVSLFMAASFTRNVVCKSRGACGKRLRYRTRQRGHVGTLWRLLALLFDMIRTRSCRLIERRKFIDGKAHVSARVAEMGTVGRQKHSGDVEEGRGRRLDGLNQKWPEALVADQIVPD